MLSASSQFSQWGGGGGGGGGGGCACMLTLLEGREEGEDKGVGRGGAIPIRAIGLIKFIFRIDLLWGGGGAYATSAQSAPGRGRVYEGNNGHAELFKETIPMYYVHMWSRCLHVLRDTSKPF